MDGHNTGWACFGREGCSLGTSCHDGLQASVRDAKILLSGGGSIANCHAESLQ